MEMIYSSEKAANYWGNERLSDAKSEIETVGYLNKPLFINEYYTKWEADILKTILKKLSPITIMDLACGVGRFTNILSKIETVKEVIAIDVTQEMLDICKKNIEKVYFHKLRFINTNSTSIPLEHESVDTIVCLGLFEHLPAEWRARTLNEITRLLPSGGSLILEINNNKSIFLVENRDNSYRKAQQLENGYFCDLIDRAEIESLLMSLGLQIVSIHRNPLFSIMYHLFLEFKNNHNCLDDKAINKWMEIAYQFDTSVKDSPDDPFADQTIFEIVKK